MKNKNCLCIINGNIHKNCILAIGLYIFLRSYIVNRQVNVNITYTKTTKPFFQLHLGSYLDGTTKWLLFSKTGQWSVTMRYVICMRTLLVIHMIAHFHFESPTRGSEYIGNLSSHITTLKEKENKFSLPWLK